jgi:hypothetical protein
MPALSQEVLVEKGLPVVGQGMPVDLAG